MRLTQVQKRKRKQKQQQLGTVTEFRRRNVMLSDLMNSLINLNKVVRQNQDKNQLLHSRLLYIKMVLLSTMANSEITKSQRIKLFLTLSKRVESQMNLLKIWLKRVLNQVNVKLLCQISARRFTSLHLHHMSPFQDRL